MQKKFHMMAILVILSLLMAACAPAATQAPTQAPTQEIPVTGSTPTALPEPTAAPEAQTITEIAAADGRFTTLVAAVEAAGLAETLSGEGPFTVFAPTDDAFASLPSGTIDALLAEPEGDLKNILLYHVVPGKVMAADVASLASAQTALGEAVQIRVEGENVYINDAQVVLTDIEASNGVIHVIDSVLIPPTAAEAQESMNIVETAVADGRFTTLAAALEAAGLVDALQGDGPFTVFAPTDDAFAKLPAGTLEGLLAEPEGNLKDILLYHVVEGEVLAADVVNLTEADTLLGRPLSIMVDGEQVMINDARVLITDIQTSNGVIHVIDTVLLPPQ